MDKFFFSGVVKKTGARVRSSARFFRIKIRKLINRCPRRLRALGGPLLGGLIGLIGGVPGFIIGLLLGCLLGELTVQSAFNRKVIQYLENPGAQKFYEGEPGLTAWCALGILVAAENTASYTETDSLKDIPQSEEQAVKQVLLHAAYVFTSPLAEPGLIDRFSRAAWSLREKLNPDLLAESFAARRASPGDAGILIRSLGGIAGNEKSRRLAREIRLIIDPIPENGKESQNPASETQFNPSKDPWKILGLAPGTEQKEVKAHYRRLAKQFHPDELQILNEKQREAAARAFMAIKEAYRQISGPSGGTGSRG